MSKFSTVHFTLHSTSEMEIFSLFEFFRLLGFYAEKGCVKRMFRDDLSVFYSIVKLSKKLYPWKWER